MFIQQCLTPSLDIFILEYKKDAEMVSPFPGSEEIKVSHYAEGQGNLLHLERALCLKHHVITRITIMLLAVLISS